MVSAGRAPRAARRADRRRAQAPWRVALALGAAAALVLGVGGGLLRAGVPVEGAAWAWAGVQHAALMIGAFFGTVIGLERAVALGHPAAYAAPAATAAAGVLLVFGAQEAGAWLLVAGALAFTLNSALIVRRQPALHTALLLAAAMASVLGAGAWAAGLRHDGVHAWWFAFLVVTIAAERLEMTRLMQRRRAAAPLLVAVLVALYAGAAVSFAAARAGHLVFGLALVALAAWLGAFDIARRTVRATGLPRYMAVCLLLGYAWLAVGGAAWALAAVGEPVRDVALHALGLGFVISMVMAHALVILPAVVGVKLEYAGVFYLPLALLQVSLAARFAAPWAGPAWRTAGALGHVVAFVVFALCLVYARRRWQRLHAR